MHSQAPAGVVVMLPVWVFRFLLYLVLPRNSPFGPTTVRVFQFGLKLWPFIPLKVLFMAFMSAWIGASRRLSNCVIRGVSLICASVQVFSQVKTFSVGCGWPVVGSVVGCAAAVAAVISLAPASAVGNLGSQNSGCLASLNEERLDSRFDLRLDLDLHFYPAAAAAGAFHDPPVLRKN